MFKPPQEHLLEDTSWYLEQRKPGRPNPFLTEEVQAEVPGNSMKPPKLRRSELPLLPVGSEVIPSEKQVDPGIGCGGNSSDACPTKIFCSCPLVMTLEMRGFGCPVAGSEDRLA